MGIHNKIKTEYLKGGPVLWCSHFSNLEILLL